MDVIRGFAFIFMITTAALLLYYISIPTKYQLEQKELAALQDFKVGGVVCVKGSDTKILLTYMRDLGPHSGTILKNGLSRDFILKELERCSDNRN